MRREDATIVRAESFQLAGDAFEDVHQLALVAVLEIGQLVNGSCEHHHEIHQHFVHVGRVPVGIAFYSGIRVPD